MKTTRLQVPTYSILRIINFFLFELHLDLVRNGEIEMYNEIYDCEICVASVNASFVSQKLRKEVSLIRHQGYACIE